MFNTRKYQLTDDLKELKFESPDVDLEEYAGEMMCILEIEKEHVHVETIKGKKLKILKSLMRYVDYQDVIVKNMYFVKSDQEICDFESKCVKESMVDPQYHGKCVMVTSYEKTHHNNICTILNHDGTQFQISTDALQKPCESLIVGLDYESKLVDWHEKNQMKIDVKEKKGRIVKLSKDDEKDNTEVYFSNGVSLTELIYHFRLYGKSHDKPRKKGFIYEITKDKTLIEFECFIHHSISNSIIQ
eukprot:UN34199